MTDVSLDATVMGACNLPDSGRGQGPTILGYG